MYKGRQDGIDCNTLAHHFPSPYSLSHSLSHLVAMWCRLHRCIVASLPRTLIVAVVNRAAAAFASAEGEQTASATFCW